MIDLMDRSASIRKRLDEMLLRDIAVSVSIVPAEEWGRVDLDPGESFGFKWPFDFEGEPLVAFSPEVMAVLTMWLDDEQFDAYMDIIEFMLARHIGLLRDGVLDVEVRRHQIEDELWATREEAMQFLSFVQMQIIDITQESP